ncbi:FxSxx-COOH system tetratricopeptide repeat protein [Nocardiopsis sp. NPDC006938]|uniref:FxSxx-COOH system tetratricopeptide repeat protein n=1 Tax=Nocardiopsis sp. NPDC006938 TaxID=3364337 RepID=UPI00369F904F
MPQDDLTQKYHHALLEFAETGGPSAILMDVSPLMDLHHRTVTALSRAARTAHLPVVPFAPGRYLPPQAERAAPWPLLCPLPPEVTSALVVTDAHDRAWRQPRVGTWLAALGERVSIALLHLLDRGSWARGPITTQPMSWTGHAPNAPDAWEPATPPDPADPGPPPGVVRAAPVLECSPEAITAWARALRDPAGGWEADVWAIGAPRRPVRGPDAEPVTQFLTHSSAGARELAVRLAQAPVNLPVAEVIQRSIPQAPRDERAAITEIAEVFGSDLMDPTHVPGALNDPASAALRFRSGARSELLSRDGELSAMRAVFYALGIEFKDHARVYQWLSRIESGVSQVTPESLEGEEELARAMLPALSEMPGEYRRFADQLRLALGDAPSAPVAARVPDPVPGPGPTGRPVDPAPVTEPPPRKLRKRHRRPPPLPREEPSAAVSETSTPSTAREPYGSEPIQIGRGTGGQPRHQRTRQMARFGGVPPTNLHFTGRALVLGRIHESLEEAEGPGTFLLCGGGGIGKTQIATEYAHLHRDDYDLIWWFPSHNDTDVQQSYAALGRYLGIQDEAGGPSVTSQRVRDALEDDPEIGRWLLIFDDFTDLSRLGVRNIPLNGPGSVLVTSREQTWLSSGRSNGIVVPKLTPEESVALLRKVCAQGLEDDTTALDIAEKLEYLPLGLAQMGAYLRDSLMSAEDFLQLLQEKFADLLDHVEPEGTYPVPLAAAWNVQLDDLRRSNEPERELKRMVREFIQLCSFFAPRPLPRTLFHRARGLSTDPALSRLLGNEMYLSRVLRYVSRHSLAEFDRTKHTFQLHGTFQAVVRSTLSTEERVRHQDLTHRLLAQSDPLAPDRPQNWDEYQLLFTHVRASEAWRSHDPQVRGLVRNVILYLIETRHPIAALELADHAIGAWYDDPAQRFQVQLMRNRILSSRGDNVTALAEARAMHAEQVELEGSESEEALDAHRASAVALTNLGHFEDARRMYEEIHRIRVSRNGEEDESTLSSAHDLAYSLRIAGRFREALEIDERNLEQRTYVFGPNGIPTLRSRLSVGVSQLELGRLDQARATLEDAQRRFEATEADGSVHSMEIPLSLSLIHRRRGEHERALELSEGAGEAQARWYPGTARSMLYFQNVHMVNLAFGGELAEAERTARALLDAVETTYSERHVFPWVARANAALVFRLAGHHAEALELDRLALSKLRETHGDNPMLFAPVEINLGNDLFALGRLKEALAQDQASERLCQEVLPEDHPSQWVIRRNLLISRQALGEDVEESWTELRNGYAVRFGPDHTFVTSMNGFERHDCEVSPVAR